MNSLTKLPTTQFSGLDFDNIMKDVYNLIVENPEYNKNWDDFLSSSAGRMFMELFSYISDQLAIRIDWNVNEVFLSTATQKSSKLKLLNLINYKLTLPNCATIPITMYLGRATNKEITLTPAYVELSGIRNNIFTLSAYDKNKVLKNFEAIQFDASNNKFLYKNKVSVGIDSSVYNSKFTLNFYEGVTKVEQFISTTQDNEIFTLTNFPVINNSVSIFIRQTIEEVTTEVELLRVNSFLENEAQDETNSIPYIINTLEDGKATIEFPPQNLMNNTNRLLPVGSTLYVFYRIGGGESCNIPIKTINLNKIITVDNASINTNFVNESGGLGGTDIETIDHAVSYGPLSLRTANKAVTIEDYKTLLELNPLILKSISYGSNNMPTNFYSKYGFYINPQEVWNFIVLNKDYSGISPSQYNNYNWLNTKLENRFNELYTFNNSKFNYYCYYFTDMAQQIFINYKTGTSRTFYNYIAIITPDEFKNRIGRLDSNNDFIIDTNFQFKVTNQETNELFFNSITDYFINNSPYIFGTVNETFYDRAEQSANAVFYSPIGVNNSVTDANNVYGFDISSKYSIGIDLDGRGMLIINLKDDYGANDNKKIYISNPTPLIKPPSGTYYNTIYEARYHKGIVEKINAAFTSNVTLYGDSAKPAQLMGLSLEDTSQAQAFSEIVEEISIPITINDVIYNISYGGVGRTSQYYSDIVTYINADLTTANSGFTCELFTLANGFKDIRFVSTVDNSILVAKTESLPNDMLYYLYNDMSATPPNPSSGGDYSNVASIVIDSNGKKYLKIISPSSGANSSLQFKVSDFKNDLNNSIEFMDTLGVKYVGNISLKVTGLKTLTLVSNYNDSNFGNFIFETNILGKLPEENKYVYAHTKGAETNSLIIGSVYTNFYSEDPETYKEINKAHYIYSTILDINGVPVMEECSFNIIFTRNKTTYNSITAIQDNSNDIINIFPYNFIDLKTIDLSIIDTTDNYFTSSDELKFSIDGGNIIDIPLENIKTRLELIQALQDAFTSAGYSSYFDYTYIDFDNTNMLHFKNKKRNLDGNIYFPSVADTNLFFKKIFGTPAQNQLKTIYREGITVHPLGNAYVELTNHPYIDANYSSVDGIYDAINFDCRIKDDNFYGGYRTPDFYYSFDETERLFSINKVSGNLIPDSEFYLHFINDKRYDDSGIPVTSSSFEETIIKEYIDKYKITGIENIIKPASFITFDIAANIVCKNSIPIENIRFGLESKLREEYALINMDFNNQIVKSKIFASIQNYAGVLYSEIIFLGIDYTDNTTNVANRIETDFDTIAILSEDIYDNFGNKKHGLIFNYSYNS